jgi:hypothetical protein
MRRSLALPLLLSVATLPSCALLDGLLGDGTRVCLDEVLDHAKLDRADLDDARLADALSMAAKLIGELPVLDCRALDASEGLLDTVTKGKDGEVRDGQIVEANNPQEVPDKLDEVLQDGPGRDADVAVLIDTTGSMWDDLDEVVARLDEIRETVESKNGRLAIAWYGDNQGCDQPWYGINSSGLLPANDPQIDSFASDTLDNGLSGGCDWPESMYDAIAKTAEGLDWVSGDRSIVVITDAEPLTGSKTDHSEQDVADILEQHKIALDLVLTAITY